MLSSKVVTPISSKVEIIIIKYHTYLLISISRSYLSIRAKVYQDCRSYFQPHDQMNWNLSCLERNPCLEKMLELLAFLSKENILALDLNLKCLGILTLPPCLYVPILPPINLPRIFISQHLFSLFLGAFRY